MATASSTVSTPNEKLPVPSQITGTMADGSYFPSQPSSHRSSMSSGSDLVTPDMADKPPMPARIATTSSTSSASAASHPAASTPLDPLSRQYPVPAGDLNLDELLARTPKKWTLGHYFKEVSARDAPAPAQDKERRARELAAAKKELLQEYDTLHHVQRKA